MRYEIETANIFDKWLAGITDIRHLARIVNRFDHVHLGYSRRLAVSCPLHRLRYLTQDLSSKIKGALQVCSTEKINGISIENSELKEILNKLCDLSQKYRQIPFVRDQTGLTIEQVQTLENNGVAYLEKEENYIPEIYRAGLGFKLKAGAHPRVLALSRGAQIIVKEG